MVKPCVPDSLPLNNINWGALVRLISQANIELARYDGVLRTIPNATMLLSPMTTQEAVLSSQIEGTQASLREVLEYQAAPNVSGDIGSQKREDIQEIINYRIAMDEAVLRLEKRPISLNLILGIHSTLLDSVRGYNKARGNFRTSQNYIGTPGSTIQTARFVPPEPMFLMEHLDNWEKYIHYDEEDRLVQLAIVHAQFEIIHPFLDGNGRVGRILIPLFLYEKGLLSSPTFYLSEYLETHRTDYTDKLLAITEENDWQGWIEFFLQAVFEQAKADNRKAQGILDLYDEMKVRVPESTHSPYAIQVLDTMFNKTIFTSSIFAEMANIPKPTTDRILSRLAADDIIQIISPSRGQLPALYIFEHLFNIVEGQSVETYPIDML